jgi:hypothetical protein
VYPEERQPLPVNVVMLPTHGTRPGEMADALEQKQQLYWSNPRRDRRIAEVAKALARARKRSVKSIFGGDAERLEEVVCAAKTGVAVLAEVPAHARELGRLLPGWTVWTANDPTVAKPETGCGVIATELAAKETVIGAGVLIRATGTRWPLPEIDWPWPEDAESGVLIDFLDEFHPLAKRNAAARVEGYEQAGMTVYRPTAEAKEH